MGQLLVTRITFRGRHYILVGEDDGAIATEGQFRTGAKSFAHLTPAGEIMRDGEVIGERDDIGFGDTVQWPVHKMPRSLN